MSSKFLLGNVLSAITNHRVSSSSFLLTEYSKLICGVVNVMKENGYIASYDLITRGNITFIKITPMLYNNKKTLNKIKLYSTPGCRLYKNYEQISHLMSKNKYNTYIFSTSAGIMSGFEAVKRKIGGEFLCEMC